MKIRSNFENIANKLLAHKDRRFLQALDSGTPKNAAGIHNYEVCEIAQNLRQMLNEVASVLGLVVEDKSQFARRSFETSLEVLATFFVGRQLRSNDSAFVSDCKEVEESLRQGCEERMRAESEALNKARK